MLNAICLALTAYLVPGFEIQGAGTAFVASLVLAVVGLLWKAVSRKEKA